MALKRLAPRRVKLGTAARRRVVAGLTLEHQAAAMHEAYRDTLRMDGAGR